MYEIINTDIIMIENLIYEIRGKQVMLDSDLAILYKCKNGTKTINQAINRNVERFPDDFYFQLTLEEYQNLKSQFGTSKFHILYLITENKSLLEIYLNDGEQLD